MKDAGRRYRVRTTFSKHDLPVAENLADRRFDVTELNQLWVGDIPYVQTDAGWLYLAALLVTTRHSTANIAPRSRLSGLNKIAWHVCEQIDPFVQKVPLCSTAGVSGEEHAELHVLQDERNGVVIDRVGAFNERQ